MIRLITFLILMIFVVPITMAYGVFSNFKPTVEYTIISVVMSVFVTFIILHLPAVFSNADHSQPVEDKLIIFYGLKLFSISMLIWLIFGFAAARAVNSIIGLEYSVQLTPVVEHMEHDRGVCLKQVKTETGQYYWLSSRYCAKLEHGFSDYRITAVGLNSVLGFDIKSIYFDDTIDVN